MKRSTKVKLIDVARAANVSAATVSRLVSGQASLDPHTRDRVLKAAVKLGFDLERGKKSRIIAFLLSNRGVLHPFHSSVLMGVEAYCAEQNYALLFLPFQYSTNAPAEELRLPEILQRSRMISGVIAAGTNSQSLLDLLTRRGIPWVGLGNNVIGEVPQAQTGLVYFDDLTGSYELTRYLLSLRHRQIAFIGNLNLPWYARRHEGYRRAMAEAGLTCQVSELNSREGEEMGYLAAKLLFQQSTMPTAIFAGDDTAARGVYNAARDIGISIPEKLSVVGFNDTPDAPALQPPLTSVRVFTDELGKQLAESLLKRIARPDLPLRDLTLPTQIVRRESCSAPSQTV
jgi:DNA-binding LacI/PurR family transcriptional regulator